ncbi:PREDICTED: zinc finger BED domain-containing protein 4-like [Wasmannia auropunctata]|uniref:zinc finger BED domain-containing protein 4-like n=1 Tax=Wasmannia auropunctata TaxID=64793 RepID=UPI0005ED984B|nr:PREDICTED: zinc finger BED domain-containing protein 4-like [Wasmannia auropunctata]
MESHDSDYSQEANSSLFFLHTDKKRQHLDFSSSCSSNDSIPIKKNDIQNYFPLEAGSSVCENNEIVKNSTETETISESDFQKISSSSAIIWNFFTRIEKDNATCNTCGTKRSTPTGTTTTLKNHLKKHLSAHQEYLRLTSLKENNIKRKKTNEERSKTNLLKNSKESLKPLFKNTYFDSSNKRAKDITKAIALFICKGLQPFSVVEEEGFKYLLHILEPRYKIPCRSTFSRTIIPDLYMTLRDEIFNDFHSAITHIESVSITTDLWSSRAKDTYIAFTLQYIDENFNMKHFTADCKPFPGSHNAIAIYQKIHEVLEDLNLNDGHISKYIVSDNGANMVRALSESELKIQESTEESTLEFLSVIREKSWHHIRCYNHTLQLAISDTRKDVGASSVIEKVSSMVGRYNKSRPARESLQFFQSEHNLPKHELLQMVETRWDSEFIMLQRFVEQKAAIISKQSKAGIDSLTVQEWKLIEGYVKC